MLFNIFFLPIVAFISGFIFKGYNPSFYDNKPKFMSQNGINLTFLKFSNKQWDYFLNKLTIRYFTIFSILSLLFNISTYLISLKTTKFDPMMYNSIFWIIIGIIIFISMVKKTKKIK